MADPAQLKAMTTEDDKRLERLFDYTKWHIGIYLSAGGGLVTLLGSSEKNDFLKQLVVRPGAMLIAVIAMLLAGIAGGVIASTATQCRTFDELWLHDHGPWKLKIMSGQNWALLEHGAFWMGVGCFVFSILEPSVLHGRFW